MTLLGVLLALAFFVLPNLALAVLGTLLMPDRRRLVVTVASAFGIATLVLAVAAYSPFLFGPLDEVDLADLLLLHLVTWALPVLLALLALALKFVSDRMSPSHRAV